MAVVLRGNMKKYGIALLFLICCGSILSWVSGKKAKEENDPFTMLRMLGHRTLLSTGDHTSKVLPIEHAGENEYIIRFENNWTLNADTLTNITKEIFQDRIEIKVVECTSNSEVYSFSIKGNESIIPCLGRQFDPGCYYIKASLLQSNVVMTNAFIYLPIVFLFLGYFTFLFLSKPQIHPKPATIENTDHTISRVKEYTFNHTTLQLNYKDSEIALSSKEADIAAQFFKSPNTLLERDYLMKTIWEDQGVIVGRSLDVFISKLRKKLTHDPDVKLISVFGKGYKLEVVG